MGLDFRFGVKGLHPKTLNPHRQVVAGVELVGDGGAVRAERPAVGPHAGERPVHARDLACVKVGGVAGAAGVGGPYVACSGVDGCGRGGRGRTWRERVSTAPPKKASKAHTKSRVVGFSLGEIAGFA
jgi:hypothetical protein